MEAGVACKLNYPTWIESERFGRNSTGSLRFGRIAKEEHKARLAVLPHFPVLTSSNRFRSVSFEISCSSSKNFSDYDASDALIEQEVNGMSVAEIFKLHGERFFRKKETEVLQRLSSKKQLVVSTGGGAVVCDVNWDYMQKKGIVVWLDVPLEALAQRIAAVGTHSRPLLHYEHGDPYTKALKRLSYLLELRGKNYAKANARVSLEEIAGKLGYRDVSDLTPTEIAIEALQQIEGYLKEEGGMVVAGL